MTDVIVEEAVEMPWRNTMSSMSSGIGQLVDRAGSEGFRLTGRVDPREAALALAHDLRLKRAVPLAWDRHLGRRDIAQHGFGPGAVAGVGAITAGRVMLGVAPMLAHR